MCTHTHTHTHTIPSQSFLAITHHCFLPPLLHKHTPFCCNCSSLSPSPASHAASHPQWTCPHTHRHSITLTHRVHACIHRCHSLHPPLLLPKHTSFCCCCSSLSISTSCWSCSSRPSKWRLVPGLARLTLVLIVVSQAPPLLPDGNRKLNMNQT